MFISIHGLSKAPVSKGTTSHPRAGPLVNNEGEGGQHHRIWYMERLRKITKRLNESSWCPYRSSNHILHIEVTSITAWATVLESLNVSHLVHM
jgi:hypothetical protein